MVEMVLAVITALVNNMAATISTAVGLNKSSGIGYNMDHFGLFADTTIAIECHNTKGNNSLYFQMDIGNLLKDNSAAIDKVRQRKLALIEFSPVSDNSAMNYIS